VKRGEGSATVSLHPTVAARRIREAAQAALSRDLKPCRLTLPERFALELGFKEHHRARRLSWYPGASLASPHVVHFETDSWFEAMRLLLFLY
jgi:D-amino peptidase